MKNISPLVVPCVPQTWSLQPASPKAIQQHQGVWPGIRSHRCVTGDHIRLHHGSSHHHQQASMPGPCPQAAIEAHSVGSEVPNLQDQLVKTCAQNSTTSMTKTEQLQVRPHGQVQRACLSGGTSNRSALAGGGGFQGEGALFLQVKCTVRS